MAMRILAIGAHPDDIDVGCAGYLQRGTERRMVVLSGGERGGHGRMTEQSASASILDASLSVHGLPDTAIDHRAAMSIIEAEVRDWAPDVVLTMSEDDTHQDHRAVADATRVAVRDLRGLVLAYCTPSSAELWQPNWFAAMTEEQMAVKLAAVACHRSQQERPYMAPEYIRSVGRYWAMVTRSQAPYVEAYQLLRMREL